MTTSEAAEETPALAHPVLRLARAVDDALDRLGDAPVWALSPREQREALLTSDRLTSRVAELEMRVLAAEPGTSDHPRRGGADP